MANIRKPTQKEEETLERSRRLYQKGIEGEKDFLSKISTTMAKSARDDIRSAKKMRESVPETAREYEAYQEAGYKKGGKVDMKKTKKMANGGISNQDKPQQLIPINPKPAYGINPKPAYGPNLPPRPGSINKPTTKPGSISKPSPIQKPGGSAPIKLPTRQIPASPKVESKSYSRDDFINSRGSGMRGGMGSSVDTRGPYRGPMGGFGGTGGGIEPVTRPSSGMPSQQLSQFNKQLRDMSGGTGGGIDVSSDATFQPVNRAAGMKKGGKVNSASKRADGCAMRGKTKGRII